MSDFSVEIIHEQSQLTKLIGRLNVLPAIALDIETVDWWNRQQERVALIQLAYRLNGQPKVAVIDALAKIDLASLRLPLEQQKIIKVIHNAVFDASRLASHYKFNVSPIFDTMVAARRSGEKRYSLQAQAEIHLKRHLDKSSQRSDWSRRPLDPKQIYYAADDAFSTLLMYENQIKRNLNGAFQLKDKISSKQGLLPLADSRAPITSIQKTEQKERTLSSVDQSASVREASLNASAQALLGVIAEFPGRYHPDGLAASVGSAQRIGMTGWIVDSILGKETDLDEETAKLAIVDLHDREFIKMAQTRKLEATERGVRLWQKIKIR